MTQQKQEEDPKGKDEAKHDEIRDAELAKVSGGAIIAPIGPKQMNKADLTEQLSVINRKVPSVLD